MLPLYIVATLAREVAMARSCGKRLHRLACCANPAAILNVARHTGRKSHDCHVFVFYGSDCAGSTTTSRSTSLLAPVHPHRLRKPPWDKPKAVTAQRNSNRPDGACTMQPRPSSFRFLGHRSAVAHSMRGEPNGRRLLAKRGGGGLNNHELCWRRLQLCRHKGQATTIATTHNWIDYVRRQ